MWKVRRKSKVRHSPSRNKQHDSMLTLTIGYVMCFDWVLIVYFFDCRRHKDRRTATFLYFIFRKLKFPQFL